MTGAMGAGFAMPNMASALAPVTEFATSFVVTLKKLTNPFEKLVDIASYFANFIDPGLVEDLTRKFRDLNAVIGVAVRPVVEVAREVVKHLSDYLLPIMRKLQPIVEKVTHALGDAMKKAILDMSKFLEDMIPTIEKLAGILVGIIGIMSDVYSALTVFARFLADAVGSLFSGFVGNGRSVKEIMEKLRETVQSVISSLTMFSARLMMSFGWTKGVESMIKAMKSAGTGGEKGDATGMAVAQNAMFKSIGDLSKSVMLEAFRSSANQTKEMDPAVQSAAFLGEIAKQLEDLMKSGDDKQSKIITAIHDVVEWVSGLKDWFKNDVKPALDVTASGVSVLSDYYSRLGRGISNTSKAVGVAEKFAEGAVSGIAETMGINGKTAVEAVRKSNPFRASWGAGTIAGGTE